jgi:hypothetical protein
LLREFYGQVAIPREVHDEVTVAGSGLPGAEEVRRASWIQVQPTPSEPSGNVKASVRSSVLESEAQFIWPHR